jgi:hypothetical protein
MIPIFVAREVLIGMCELEGVPKPQENARVQEPPIT